MKLPLGGVLERCKTGFPLWQKMLMTCGVVLYAVSPLDILPDVFVPVGFADDVYLLYVLVRVWRSPTLSPYRGSYSQTGQPSSGNGTTHPVGRRAIDEVLR
ncbi:hypothetical protein RAS1_13410 [Phycisphaerae bacterium RAS1]|nr:hypothetical protein RAS1_13410 [Phycisphaerae bacterium RAS1]